VPAHVWTRLEADYRHNKARLEDQARLKHELPLVARYPYPALAAHGWVRKTRDALEQLEELLRFFGVASLKQVPSIQAAAFRRSRNIHASPEALASWLRQGERQGQALAVAKFSASKMRAALPELRSLTQLPPQEFDPRLRQLLSDAGVALVLLPHLPGTGAQGATCWLTPDKALVQMSIRYRWADVFWFSLFHEIGHLLLHNRNVVFIEDNGDEKPAPEQEADRFAADELIPPASFQAFIKRTDGRTQAAVVAFAQEIGVDPSIVVGRLHHEGHLPHSHLNNLRSRFAWAEA
jgi:HTH-type transcriptional regulator/antitoxin HigA